MHPISIVSFSPPSSCNSVPAYQILSELDDRRRSYDVVDF